MNDKINESFSFRMFDLYRRFVEILQLNPNFLEEFKTGTPTKEVCRNIIKRVFRLRQSEEKITHLTKYLSKNALIIVSHAENLPSNWREAVKYTNACIKQIHKLLQQKQIDIVKDLESVNELSEEIGKCLHKTPNEKQIETIREYLKFDLHNPKKRIILNTSKKQQNKTKLIKSKKVKNLKVVKVAKNNLKMVLKKSNDESSQTIDKLNANNEFIKICNENKDSKVSSENNMSQSQENLLKTDNTEIKQLLQTVNEKSNLLKLFVEDLKSSNFSQENDLNNSHLNDALIIDASEFSESEYITSFLKNPKCHPIFFESNEIPQRQSEVTVQNKDKHDENNSSTELDSRYCFKLKRRSSDYNKSNTHDCTKKLFSSTNLLHTQEEQLVTINYCNNKNENCEYDMIQFPILNTEEISINNDNDTNIEINIGSKIDDETRINENYYSNLATNLLFENVKIEKENENYVTLSQCKNNVRIRKNCNAEDKVTYSNISNISYTEILKLIETIMTFCELKNEISLEEFLVLRRTRDKIHLKSLQEFSNIKKFNLS